jgi:gamma-glutamyltranspeptidase/glutathione hydrolase
MVIPLTRRELTGGVVGLGLTASLGSWSRASNRPSFQSRSEIYSPHGMVATSQPLAVAAGLHILREGGSAVDAAIAANAVLGVVEPVGCGLGGDLFAIIWDPNEKRLVGLNASGAAPLNQSLSALKSKLGNATEIPPVGTACVTTPGAAGGWAAAHKRYGRLPMSAVLAPAIHYAEQGAPISPLIAQDWALNLRLLGEQRAYIEEYDNTLATFSKGGHAPRTGEQFRNPDLANTYRLIAKGGGNAFYRGAIAEKLTAYMDTISGPLSARDLSQFEPEWVDTIATSYRGAQIHQIPPNSQGITVLQMLALLEPYDLATMKEADRIHVMVEAKKQAFADRAKLIADPRFSDNAADLLLDPDRLSQQRAAIDLQISQTSTHADEMIDGDTIYLSAADNQGMMVSWIQSNFRGMGCGLTPTGLGFMLQNRGAQFNLNAKHANVYAPGKRPFHTIIPGFAMKADKPWMSFGVMGGSMQPQGQVQVLSRMLDEGMTPQAAGDAPRWRHNSGATPQTNELGDETLFLEPGIAEDVATELAARGHLISRKPENFGGYQCVVKNGDGPGWVGASEKRKDGMAAGY